MTLRDFEAVLVAFDWDYLRSDDSKVIRGAQSHLRRLETIAKSSAEHGLTFVAVQAQRRPLQEVHRKQIAELSKTIEAQRSQLRSLEYMAHSFVRALPEID